MLSLACEPLNLERQAESFAHRVAVLYAQGFLACARGSEACGRSFLACEPGELADARAPVRDLEVSTALVIVRAIQIQTLGGGAWERVLGCWGGAGGCRGGMLGQRWTASCRQNGTPRARPVLGQDKMPQLAGPRWKATPNQLLASMSPFGCRWIRPTCGDLTRWSNCS